MMYMLDTDICIYIIKRKPLNVLKRLETITPEDLCMSSITFAELVNGAKKSVHIKENLNKLSQLSDVLEILPFDKDAALAYGDVRSDLEKRGLVIGGNDLFIAAHAISQGAILVTNNEREFGRVTGLPVENWTR
ncbi:MAG: type II toxin-antitoxin system VapC family toxin [Desulfobacterales bacterium]|nr:type II toxin-antitoxin system VapC family toxin [Desulfobacterales bacterium]MBI9085342.1 type II toxin-antitoxin system VapC family toxin [Desulfobacterales bacterium]